MSHFKEFDPTKFGLNVPNKSVEEQITEAVEFPVVRVEGMSPVVLNPDEHVSEVITTGETYLTAFEHETAIRAELDVFDVKRSELQRQIDLIREEMQKKMQSLKDEIAVIDEETYDTRQALKRATRETDSALRLFKQAVENEMASKKFLDETKKFDEETQDFHWRQFAFKHQIEGAKYLAANRRVILGDKMGLGKSLTSLITMDMLKSKKILIIVPDDVASNFTHEIHKWCPHRMAISIARKTKGEREAAMKILSFMQDFIIVVNYSAWRRDNSLLDTLSDLRFDTVVIDEAHTIKETTTNAYKGVKKIVLAENQCPECGGGIRRVNLRVRPDDYRMKKDYFECRDESCGWSQNRDIEQMINRPAFALASAKNVYPMTGTAILNKPTDLFTLLSLIDPINFREKYQFEWDYCTRDLYSNKLKFKSGGLTSLIKRLSGKWLARDRHSAGIVLPKQEILFHNLELDPEMYPKQYKTITQLTKYATIMLESGKQLSAIAAIALITRKRQANVWPGGIVQRDMDGNVVFSVADDVNESIKVDWCIDPKGEGNVVDMTEGGFEQGDRVVVFSQFKDPLKEIEKRLIAAGISVVRFDGDTPDHIRDQVKFDFDRTRCNEPGYQKKWQVVLANYKTGGQGLNFTDVTQMVVLDSEWNPGKEDQAMGRIDRMGQTEETTVHVLEVENTIDVWMRSLINDKSDLVNGFESSANMATALLNAMKNGEML